MNLIKKGSTGKIKKFFRFQFFFGIPLSDDYDMIPKGIKWIGEMSIVFLFHFIFIWMFGSKYWIWFQFSHYIGSSTCMCHHHFFIFCWIHHHQLWLFPVSFFMVDKNFHEWWWWWWWSLFYDIYLVFLNRLSLFSLLFFWITSLL